MEFLRGILGVVGIACAFMAGRSIALHRRGRQKIYYVYAWVFRMAACLIAVAYRNPLDTADIAIGSLAACAFASALWTNLRVKNEEEPPIRIFTDES
jgi:hypothetical protein